MGRQIVHLGVAAFLILNFEITLSASPHIETAACMRDENMICNEVCLSCHAPELPPSETAMQATGDIGMCGFCHYDESAAKEGGALLVGHGGNHSSQIAYDRGQDSELNPNPEGPVLYCDVAGSNCMMLCSTCHDPHSDKPGLLRIENRASVLCLSCHLK